MASTDKQKRVFTFLREHARSGEPFTVEEMNDAVGWKGQTAEGPASKQYADYLEDVGPGSSRVLPEFKRLQLEEFLELVTQARHPFPVYDRGTYYDVVVYDFLMPLTREDKLRKALDELFYRDTLERRIREAGLGVFYRRFPRGAHETDARYVERLIDFIDERISGFSVSHVSGRFRVGMILSRKDAGERFAGDKPYLIDETTAVVRFIIPCKASHVRHQADFELDQTAAPTAAAIEEEVAQIRCIFVEIFVEAIVPTIRGEKLIWMLEASPTGHRLYELDRVDRSPESLAGHSLPR